MAAAPARAQQAEQGPIAVLTDTVEYCDQLQLRLNRCAVRTTDVQQLVKQGRQMCDHGEIRGGIAVLRRAIMLQKHSGPCR